MSEAIVWIDSNVLPDSDTTVLVHIPNDTEPVWVGFHNGENWCDPDGLPLVHPVKHWAHMPGGPA